MNAVIGIGFKTDYRNILEAGIKLDVPKILPGFKGRLTEKLKTHFNIDSLYIFYDRGSSTTVAVVSNVLAVASPFSYLNCDIPEADKNLIELQKYIDSNTSVGLCIFVTDELP